MSSERQVAILHTRLPAPARNVKPGVQATNTTHCQPSQCMHARRSVSQSVAVGRRGGGWGVGGGGGRTRAFSVWRRASWSRRTSRAASSFFVSSRDRIARSRISCAGRSLPNTHHVRQQGKAAGTQVRVRRATRPTSLEDPCQPDPPQVSQPPPTMSPPVNPHPPCLVAIHRDTRQASRAA